MKSFNVLGVKIDDVGFSGILDFVNLVIEQKQKAQIATVNNEFIIEAQHNPSFKNALNNSSLSIPDSTGVAWAVKKLYKTTIKRTAGADLFTVLCKNAQLNKQRVFLLGAGEGIGRRSKENLLKKYPKLQIVGVKDGVMVDEKRVDLDLISEINRTKTDILFVALGAPKQEIWIANNLEKTNASVYVGIGGTLDFISGRIKRAPKFLRSMGLEWLYRLFKEPKRFKRIIIATIVFPYMILTKG